jgi:hypothetical protein
LVNHPVYICASVSVWVHRKENKTCFSNAPPKLSNYRSLLRTPSRGMTICICNMYETSNHQVKWWGGGSCGRVVQQDFIFRLHERFRCRRRRLFSASIVRISADVMCSRSGTRSSLLFNAIMASRALQLTLHRTGAHVIVTTKL